MREKNLIVQTLIDLNRQSNKYYDSISPVSRKRKKIISTPFGIENGENLKINFDIYIILGENPFQWCNMLLLIYIQIYVQSWRKTSY